MTSLKHLISQKHYPPTAALIQTIRTSLAQKPDLKPPEEIKKTHKAIKTFTEEPNKHNRKATAKVKKTIDRQTGILISSDKTRINSLSTRNTSFAV